MIRVRKVLYTTDFSPSAELALPHALHIAAKYGAELHMLHVSVLHKDDPFNPTHHFPDREAIEKRLHALAADRIDALPGETAASDLVIKQVQRREVSAAPAIVEYAGDEDVDVVVMGTHGRRGFSHLIAGSVTEEVVRTAPCAVLAVRGDGTPRPVTEIRRVLAPVDFSGASTEVVRVAADLAESYGAELQLLHVIEERIHPAFYKMGARSMRDFQPDIEERTLAALGDLLGDAAGPATSAETFAVEGHPAREILRFAETHGSDFVVISTHGHGELEAFLIGSVAEKVVRRAPCPVLTVKPTHSLVETE